MADIADIAIGLLWNDDDPSFQILKGIPLSSAFMECLGLVRVLRMMNDWC
jgi:hypothetical protein